VLPAKVLVVLCTIRRLFNGLLKLAYPGLCSSQLGLQTTRFVGQRLVPGLKKLFLLGAALDVVESFLQLSRRPLKLITEQVTLAPSRFKILA
jgi:hypothetical protein